MDESVRGAIPRLVNRQTAEAMGRAVRTTRHWRLLRTGSTASHTFKFTKSKTKKWIREEEQCQPQINWLVFYLREEWGPSRRIPMKWSSFTEARTAQPTSKLANTLKFLNSPTLSSCVNSTGPLSQSTSLSLSKMKFMKLTGLSNCRSKSHLMEPFRQARLMIPTLHCFQITVARMNPP